jgi:hypothetical protein
MSDDIEQEQYESNAASPEHGTPSRPASSGWTEVNMSRTPGLCFVTCSGNIKQYWHDLGIGKSVAKDMIANGRFVEETEAVQPTDVLSHDHIVDVTEATGDISEYH